MQSTSRVDKNNNKIKPFKGEYKLYLCVGK
jgi:hypothetical protein